MLGLEPGQGALVIGKELRSDTGPQHGDVDRLTRRAQQEGGAVGSVQVVAKEPADRGLALGFAVAVAGLVGGVGAEQVVEGIPAGSMLGD